MKLKHLLIATAMTALLGSQAAMATVITATRTGFAELGTGSSLTAVTGYVTPSPNGGSSTAHVYIAGESFTASPNGAGLLPEGKFDAWCVDIYNWLQTPSQFTLTDGAALAADLTTIRPGTPTGVQRVGALEQLASAYYDSVLALHTQVESAAFQLAVWAITYGSTDANGNYHLTSTDTNFHVDAATLTSAWGTKANTWLGGFKSAAPTSNYDIVYLQDANNPKTQDMVVFVKSGGSTVPEPGSIALVGLGLLAAAWGRRRRS